MYISHDHGSIHCQADHADHADHDLQAEFTGSLRAGEADAKLQALLKGQMKFSVLPPGSFQWHSLQAP